MRLEMMTKVISGPGGGMRLSQTAVWIFVSRKAFAGDMRFPGNALRTAVDGHGARRIHAVRMRRDEVEAAWIWVEPILDAWASRPDHPRPYSAGSWGPTAAIALIERDGRTWHEDIE